MWGDRLTLEPQAPAAAGPPGPAGPPGNAYHSVVTDSAASAGQVAKVASGGHVQLATGATEAANEGLCGIYGTNVAAAGTAQVYGPGTRAPIAGLGVGEVFRTSAGNLVLWGNPALVSGDYTRRCGNSDNSFVWVDFGPVFLVP